MIPKQWIQKYYYVRFHSETSGAYRVGYYINDKSAATHWAVTGDDGTFTIITVTHNKKIYNRRYEKAFSDHGLKLVCSKMIRDVINNKF
jgi:hypothetical protein